MAINRFGRVVIAGLASAAVLTWPAASIAQDGGAANVQQAGESRLDQRYLRTIEDAEKNTVVLQMAVRRFERAGQPGPSVTMHSAIHIADKPYYERLQQMLDGKDVVLFESVKPPGTGRPEHSLKDAQSDEARIKTTKLRLRLLGIAAKMHEQKTGALPASLEQLLESVSGKLEAYVDSASKDGWGQAFTYEIIEPKPAGEAEGGAAVRPSRTTFDIVSLGADGHEGGDGAAADIRLSQQKPIKSKDIPKPGDKGLQHDLATALGLVFQLDEMTHEHAHWRNSDLSIDQVQERLSAAGGDAEQLFSMLDGSSMQAGLIKMVLGLIKMMPGVQVMGKLMLMEALGQADRLMTSLPGMEKTFDVIVKDRNQVVIDDLKSIIEKEPGVKTVGIIYGGAHMPDLEDQLAQLGYHEVVGEGGVEWVDAITVELPANKAERKQLESMRKTIRQSLEQQIKQAKKAADKKKAEE